MNGVKNGCKLLLHVFPTFAQGGAQMRFVALANYLGAAYRHAIVSLDGNLSCRERLSPALDVQFPEIEVTRGNTLGNLRRYRAALRKIRPDILVTSNWGSIEWAMASFPSIARHIHTEDGFGPEESLRQLRRRVVARRLVLRHSDVVLPSRTLFRIASEIWRLPKHQLHYISNGINLERFKPAEKRTAATIPTVGCVAALRPEKNLGRLLRAVRLVADKRAVRLVVVGDGPERPSLMKLAAELALDTQFLGSLSDPAPVYRDFDIFALSSDTEQMPLSVIEAMATGLPVAATNVGDVSAMVSPDNQPFITSCDDADLARSILTLLGMPEHGRAIGLRNRGYAEVHFDETVMFRRYRALIDEAK